MKYILIIILLVGILLFGCTTSSSNNKFIGCWQPTEPGAEVYILHIDSDGSGSYASASGHWTTINGSQIRLDLANSGISKYIDYYKGDNKTAEHLIMEGAFTVTFYKCKS